MLSLHCLVCSLLAAGNLYYFLVVPSSNLFIGYAHFF